MTHRHVTLVIWFGKKMNTFKKKIHFLIYTIYLMYVLLLHVCFLFANPTCAIPMGNRKTELEGSRPSNLKGH